MSVFDIVDQVKSLWAEPAMPALPVAPDPHEGSAAAVPLLTGGGGPKDVAYAEPYADFPQMLTAPKAPKTPKVSAFGFDQFAPLAPKRPGEPAEPSPRLVKGVPTKTFHTGGMKADGETFEKTQAGVAVDAGFNLTVGGRRADGVDDKGKVSSGGSAAVSIGPKDGLTLGGATMRDGKTLTGGFQMSPSGGTTASTSYGTKKTSAGGAVSMNGPTTAMALSAKHGPVGVSFGTSETREVKQDKIGDSGLDATLHDFVGDGSYTEVTRGRTFSAGADLSGGGFGVGGSAYSGSLTKRRHFTAGPQEQASGFPQFGPPPEVDDVHDVDLAKLKPGEGYSVEQNKLHGGEGHVEAGFSFSLGRDDAEMSQTVLARDAHGDLRVMVAEGDAESLTGSISASKAASLSSKETDARMSQISFTAHGAEGEQAVKEFQKTGLLPGADKLGLRTDPMAAASYEGIRREYEVAQKEAESLKGPGAVYAKSRLDALQSQLTDAAGKLNHTLLEKKGKLIDSVGVPGISYDEHTIAEEHEKDLSMTVFGADLFHTGTKRSDYDREHRDASGNAQMELGHGEVSNYISVRSESADIALNPKGVTSKDGAPIALRMTSEQGTTQRERDVLARLGPEAFDMPAETLEAWRDGTMNEAQLADVAVNMTGGQLDKIRDKLAIPNAVTTMTMASSVSGLYEQVQSGADAKTQTKALLGDADAERDVKRYQQLNALYEGAAAARARQVLGVKEGQPLTPEQERAGMALVMSSTAGVKTPEDFLKLTPEEQKLVVATGAIGLSAQGQNSYESMRLAMQVKDPGQRNELMRQVFSTSEALNKGADSAVDFVQWVQTSSELNHLSKEEISELLSGVTVRLADPDTADYKKTRDEQEKLRPGEGNAMLGKELAGTRMTFDGNLDEHMHQRGEERAADRITDRLQAVQGDPKALEEVMAAAIDANPDFEEEMRETLAKDPARAAMANHILRGTRYYRGK